MRISGLSILLVLLFCTAAFSAETYKWVDEKGNVHFTDNLFNVPGKELESVKIYREVGSERDSVIPLQKTGAGYLVGTMINGQAKANLVVDTGASSTVISPAILTGLGIAIRNDPAVEMKTAGGTVNVGWAYVDKISVDGKEKKNMRVIAHDAVPGADGLLGMDFLGDYRVEILSSGPSLKLTPP